MRLCLSFGDGDNGHFRAFAGGWQEGFERFGVDNRRPGLAVLNVMDVIRGTRERIHRNGHSADFGSAKEGGDELRGIQKYDKNAVATGDAQI